MQTEESKITELIIIITGIFFIAALFMVRYVVVFMNRQKKNKLEKLMMQEKFQQQLFQSQIETQEETMSMLGKELHDNVGQLLSSTKLLIGVTERSLNTPPETLVIASNTLSQAIHELRSLSKSLNKDWLEQFNLIENLNAEIDRINAAKTIVINCSHPASLPILANKQIILFRIVQEAIQNALKHAEAKKISIAFTVEESSINLTIIDDGKGFVIESVTNGSGLLNIKHRVQLLGGNAEWQSNKEGTTIHISLPIKLNND